MSELSKQALKVDNNTSFPNNTTNYITPAILRAYNVNVIDSVVVEEAYQTFTQSVLESLDALDAFTASMNTSASLAVTTASFDNGTRNLTFTKGDTSTFSVNIPDASGSSIPAGTISGSSQITALGFVSSSVTASTLVTASFSGNTLTFTKGDGATFGIVIPDVSGSTIPAGTVSGSAQVLAYGIFATTGSNTFVGAQSISGAVSATGNGLFGDYVSNQYPALQTKVSTTTNPGNIYSTVGINNDGDSVGSSGIYASTFTSFGSGLVTGIYGGGTGNKFAGDGGNTAIYLEGSRMQIVKDTIVSGSLAVSSSLSVNGSPVVVSSQTGSFITESETGSFATLLANTFNGNQTISGSFSTTEGATFGNTTSQYNNLSVVTSKTNYPGNVYNTIGIDTDGSGQWSAGFYTSTYTSLGSEPAFGLYGGGIGNAGSNNILESYGNLLRINKNTQISGSLAVSASLTVNGSNVVVSSQTASFITESETGSFATLGANTFNGNQTISGSLTTNGGATFGNRSAQYNNIGLVTSLTNYPGNLYNSIGIDVDNSSQYNGGFYVSTYTSYGSNPAFGLYGGGNGNDGSNTILISAGNLARITKNTQITGSLGVTGSITIQSGSGDLYVHGHKQFNCGAWQDLTTQSGSADTAYKFKFDTVDVLDGVILSGSTGLQTTATGIYNIQWSGQLVQGASSADVTIWLRKNGTDISGTGGKVTMASNTKLLPAWNYMLELNANDVVEIMWGSTSSATTWEYIPAATIYPACASIIATISQVR